MSAWAPAIGSVLLVTAMSLVGVVGLQLRDKALQKALVFLVPFAAGALLGDAFFHIIPELVEEEGALELSASLGLVGGIVIFFMLEKVLHWHHAHFPGDDVIHPVAMSNLFGDALHNLIDGSLIGASYLVSTEVGIATTIAVVLHEIPQELGDFGILVHSGVPPRRALRLNLLTGSTAVVGALFALLSGEALSGQLLLPVAAGAFIYIASTDLLPELHKEPEPRKSLLQVGALVLGLLVMIALLALE
ncbi:MAG TPA: ZIP family metal transporter [Actinomycetota bacterium]|nr:ZIP family metal transporter [Actinomycetota bacterium]